jgi:ketosteroid isomerase-like protein
MDRVAAIREVYGEWERGNYGAGLELYEPGMTLEVHSSIPEAGIYDGREGLQRYMRGFLATWEEYAIRADDVEAEGDQVIVNVHHAGRASGASVEMNYFQVWTFDGERVVRVDIARSRDEALTGALRPPASP